MPESSQYFSKLPARQSPPRSVRSARNRRATLLDRAKLVIAQREVPLATVGDALARAHALGKTVILNPAPATGPLPADWYAHIDYLVPNESEASLLTGLPVDDLQQAEAAARQLVAAGARQVLLTLGGQSLLQYSADSCRHHPGTLVKPTGTTATDT